MGSVCEGCEPIGFSAPHTCLTLVQHYKNEVPVDYPCTCNVDQACASWRPIGEQYV